jgi:hypothetical protein
MKTVPGRGDTMTEGARARGGGATGVFRTAATGGAGSTASAATTSTKSTGAANDHRSMAGIQ